uniref:Short chain dehydrogenase/reductase family 39U member 1 n=1 Tax=Latimeria chalumnae TaxID=7897 RepID=H3A091_LATCH
LLLGGGTGFVGRALSRLLQNKGHEVSHISRQPGAGRITWSRSEGSGVAVLITLLSLSGISLACFLSRWNEDFKKEVACSRIGTTTALAQAILGAEKPPRVWVLITGVGYYQPSRTAEYTEDSPGGDFDYLSRLVKQWEAAAKLPEERGAHTRQVVIRSGVVLGKDGGAIQQMIWPFWLGAGGPIGSGQQFFPWIHVDDLAGMIVHVLETEGVNGVLNGVAPSADTNAAFTQAFATALWRPAFLPLPGFVVNAVFGPERGTMLLEGQRVIPKRTLESGFVYSYPDLSSALKNIVG